MKRVIVESPFAGDVERNLRYVRACMRDCLLRGEAPFASHALYTQLGVLDDTIPEQRKLGMDAGFAYRHVADVTAFYVDLGWSRGMRAGQAHAEEFKKFRPEHEIVTRMLGGEWEQYGHEY